MPARIVLTITASEIAGLFALPHSANSPEPKARYNVAPEHLVPVIRLTNGVRECADLRWGLIPHWNNDPMHEGFANARSETVAEKPSFRDAFRSRRCLVPANGFYGWKAGGPRKQPYYFCPTGGGIFVCAGIWDRWIGPQGAVETVTVLTMPSNELVMPMDPRMPVVVDEEHFAAWLDPNTKQPTNLISLFAPYPAAQMQCWPVSTRVNSVTQDDPGLIAPLFQPS